MESDFVSAQLSRTLCTLFFILNLLLLLKAIVPAENNTWSIES